MWEDSDAIKITPGVVEREIEGCWVDGLQINIINNEKVVQY